MFTSNDSVLLVYSTKLNKPDLELLLLHINDRYFYLKEREKYSISINISEVRLYTIYINRLLNITDNLSRY